MKRHKRKLQLVASRLFPSCQFIRLENFYSAVRVNSAFWYFRKVLLKTFKRLSFSFSLREEGCGCVRIDIRVLLQGVIEKHLCEMLSIYLSKCYLKTSPISFLKSLFSEKLILFIVGLPAFLQHILYYECIVSVSVH